MIILHIQRQITCKCLWLKFKVTIYDQQPSYTSEGCVCVCTRAVEGSTLLDEQLSLDSLINSHLFYECIILINPFKTLRPLRTQGKVWPVRHYTFHPDNFKKILLLNSGYKSFGSCKCPLFLLVLSGTMHITVTCLIST